MTRVLKCYPDAQTTVIARVSPPPYREHRHPKPHSERGPANTKTPAQTSALISAPGKSPNAESVFPTQRGCPRMLPVKPHWLTRNPRSCCKGHTFITLVIVSRHTQGSGNTGQPHREGNETIPTQVVQYFNPNNSLAPAPRSRMGQGGGSRECFPNH